MTEKEWLWKTDRPAFVKRVIRGEGEPVTSGFSREPSTEDPSVILAGQMQWALDNFLYRIGVVAEKPLADPDFDALARHQRLNSECSK